MPLPTLLDGMSALLADLYQPDAYFQRALNSLEVWKTKPSQTVPDTLLRHELRLMASSIWIQGVRSGYRRAYWRFLGTIVHRYRSDPVKLMMGLGLLVAAHHFLVYARQVADELDHECAKAGEVGDAASTRESIPAV